MSGATVGQLVAHGTRELNAAGVDSAHFDASNLLAGALEVENRRTVEHELLAEYVAELAARGVEYSMEQCLADYALGSLHGVIIAITATTMADQTERGDALFTLMINRHGRHALDFDVLDRLERELN